MIDVRKLLAWLNPRISQYKVGSGGIPEITPADISWALGVVGDNLGREILCHVWWPDGALHTRDHMLTQMRDLQLQEWIRRVRRMECAQLAHHVACEMADGTHGRMRGEVHRTRSEVEDAKGDIWPRIGPQSRYLAIREGVLAEMLDPHLCPVCNGAGEVRADAVVRQCGRCLGSGHGKATDTDRAERVGCTRQTYTDSWMRPYEWLLEECAHAERHACGALARALEIAG